VRATQFHRVVPKQLAFSEELYRRFSVVADFPTQFVVWVFDKHFGNSEILWKLFNFDFMQFLHVLAFQLSAVNGRICVEHTMTLC
jgi:hypothetical protein